MSFCIQCFVTWFGTFVWVSSRVNPQVKKKKFLHVPCRFLHRPCRWVNYSWPMMYVWFYSGYDFSTWHGLPTTKIICFFSTTPLWNKVHTSWTKKCLGEAAEHSVENHPKGMWWTQGRAQAWVIFSHLKHLSNFGTFEWVFVYSVL